MTPLWQQALENDLEWREAELVSLKFAVAQAAPHSVSYKALLRASWAMLYAHYEGFCLYALSVFLDEIQKSGATRHQCEHRVLLFSLEAPFRKLRKEAPPTADLHSFCQVTFPTLMSGNIEFEIDKDGDFVIAGRSNLYATNLLEHCENMCLAESCIEMNKTKLGLLVARRNKIAHGKEEVVKDLAEYKQYEDAAIDVMYDLALAIIDSLERKTYLKPAFRDP